MKRNKKTFGQTTLEFALTLPAMLIFIMGIMDLGRFLYYNSMLTNAVREGTRYGIVQQEYDESTLADIAQKVTDYTIGTKPEDLSVTVTYFEEDRLITVTTAYTFLPATPIGILILGSGDGIVMHAEATMSVDN